MSEEVLTVILAGAFSLVGVAIGAGITLFGSRLEHRRQRAAAQEDAADRERAVLHGAFAVCNFLNSRLNEWDSTRSLGAFARMSVAQPYVARLIELSPESVN